LIEQISGVAVPEGKETCNNNKELWCQQGLISPNSSKGLLAEVSTRGDPPPRKANGPLPGADANSKCSEAVDNKRFPRRQHLIAHLYAAGPRPVLEAMLELEAGKDLDDVLAAYGRIPVATYHALGANRLPIHQPFGVISGGCQ
jgi:hypothetical protein